MYDLDDVKDHFVFKVNGAQYKMTFPTVEEVEKLQKISEKATTKEEKIKAGKKTQEYILSFIKPIESKDPEINTVMKKMNIQSLNKFNKMIETEFGLAV